MCYGLEEVPENDFICSTCQAFEDMNKLVSCALCTMKGGIMRPTTIKFREKLNFMKQNSSKDH